MFKGAIQRKRASVAGTLEPLGAFAKKDIEPRKEFLPTDRLPLTLTDLEMKVVKGFRSEVVP